MRTHTHIYKDLLFPHNKDSIVAHFDANNRQNGSLFGIPPSPSAYPPPLHLLVWSYFASEEEEATEVTVAPAAAWMSLSTART